MYFLYVELYLVKKKTVWKVTSIFIPKPSLVAHRGFTDAIRAAKEVSIFKGRVAALELFGEVTVKALGCAGGGRSSPLLTVGQLEVLHLLGHTNTEAPEGRRRQKFFYREHITGRQTYTVYCSTSEFKASYLISSLSFFWLVLIKIKKGSLV